MNDDWNGIGTSPIRDVALRQEITKLMCERDEALAEVARLREVGRSLLNDLENAHAMLCATADPEGECLGCNVSERMDAARAALAEEGEK